MDNNLDIHGVATNQEDPMAGIPGAESAPTTNSGLSADDLTAVREIVLRAYPETVPELIAGASVAEMLGSVEVAAAAYQRIAEGVAARIPAPPPSAPVVPAGSTPPVAIDPERLPPVEKIRRGLAAR